MQFLIFSLYKAIIFIDQQAILFYTIAYYIKIRMMDHQIDRSAGCGVRTSPPMLYCLIFLVCSLLPKLIFLNHAIFQSQTIKFVGIPLIVAAVLILYQGFNSFHAQQTTILFSKPVTALITQGIFNYSRNPIYLGYSLLYVGFMCSIGNWWHLILFPFLIVIMQVSVIGPEEKYLERAFGQQYLDYKNKVRRWL